jgi:hypothetical protein
MRILVEETRADANWEPRFLADGRIMVIEATGEGSRTLRLLDRDGNLLRIFELGPGPRLSLGGLISANQLVVSAGEKELRTAEILDLATGARQPLGASLRPIAAGRIAPSSLATRVFSTPSALVLVDPATGKRSPLITIANTRKEPS